MIHPNQILLDEPFILKQDLRALGALVLFCGIGGLIQNVLDSNWNWEGTLVVLSSLFFGAVLSGATIVRIDPIRKQFDYVRYFLLWKLESRKLSFGQLEKVVVGDIVANKRRSSRQLSLAGEGRLYSLGTVSGELEEAKVVVQRLEELTGCESTTEEEWKRACTSYDRGETTEAPRPFVEVAEEKEAARSSVRIAFERSLFVKSLLLPLVVSVAVSLAALVYAGSLSEGQVYLYGQVPSSAELHKPEWGQPAFYFFVLVTGEGQAQKQYYWGYLGDCTRISYLYETWRPSGSWPGSPPGMILAFFMLPVGVIKMISASSSGDSKAATRGAMIAAGGLTAFSLFYVYIIVGALLGN